MKALLLALVLVPTMSFASQRVTLNSNESYVDNAVGEDVVCERTAYTPNEVKLHVNPKTEYKRQCVQTGYENRCGYDSFHCGTYTRTICGRRGCRTIIYPAYCCYSESYCIRYENVPVKSYEEVKLKFKKAQPVSPGAVDLLDLVPVSYDKFDVRVLQSEHPYTIKNKKGKEFEFRQ
jgi:hypothetical protein